MLTHSVVKLSEEWSSSRISIVPAPSTKTPADNPNSPAVSCNAEITGQEEYLLLPLLQSYKEYLDLRYHKSCVCGVFSHNVPLSFCIIFYFQFYFNRCVQIKHATWLEQYEPVCIWFSVRCSSGRGASPVGFLWKAPGCENRASHVWSERLCQQRVQSGRATLDRTFPTRNHESTSGTRPLSLPSGKTSGTGPGKCTCCIGTTMNTRV